MEHCIECGVELTEEEANEGDQCHDCVDNEISEGDL